MRGNEAAAKAADDPSNMVFLDTHENVADTMRLILESTGEGIYGIDSQGHCTFINRAGARLLGVEPAAVLGKSIHQLFHHSHADGSPYPEGECPEVRSLVEAGISQVESEVFWRADGTSFPVSYSSHPIIDNGVNKGVVVAFSDITARRRLEGELVDANHKLRAWVADLERRNNEANLLNEMGDLLQSCFTPEEAQAAIATSVEKLFPGDSGALCMLNERSLVESIAAWGPDRTSDEVFAPEDCWALRRGQIHAVADPTHGLNCQHLAGRPSRSYICVPMMARGQALGVLHVSIGAGPAAQTLDTLQPLARTVAEHVGLAMANFNLRQTLRIQSIRDQVTGLFNRRYMEETINREIPRAVRYHRPLGIILFDIDHFKVFNDTFGHAAGDTVLATLGEFVRAHIRSEDIACRYGGEEIVLILPDAPLEVTQARAEKLRTGIEGLVIEHHGRPLGPVTVSLGVADFPRHGATGESVLRAADEALYRAKESGRNQVVIAEPPAADAAADPPASS